MLPPGPAVVRHYIRPEHKMTVVQVHAEIEPEELRVVKTIETLPRRHIITF
jgi:hypothetical protein